MTLALYSGASYGNSCGALSGPSDFQSSGYGGVSFSKSAEVMLQATDIEGAAYDQATGQIIFYGKRNTSLPDMEFDDLAVAIKSVYGLGEKPAQDPGVSINTEPSEIVGQAVVRYDGDTENTNFGKVMFDADRLLKGLSNGRDNETGADLTVNLPGYKSFFDLAIENPAAPGENIRQRIWFEPDQVSLKKTSEGSSMVFDEVSMKALAVAEDPVTGEDVDPTVAGDLFSAFLTDHYDEIAIQYPVLNELKRLGKITAVVKWMKDNNIPLDLSFVEGYDPAFAVTPDYTSLDTVQRTVGSTVFTIEGGVKYRLNSENYSEVVDGQAQVIMSTAVGDRPDEGTFYWDFNSGGQQYVAIAQSVHRSKKEGNFTWAAQDLNYPVPGDLSLSLSRHYDSFSHQDRGFGKGWYATPMGLRFAGQKLSLNFGGSPAINKVAYYDFYFRVGSAEELFTVYGLDANQNPVYLSESEKYTISYDEAGQTFHYSAPNQTSIVLDNRGLLSQITDANSLSLNYAYSEINGKTVLDKITHSNGRELDLQHDGQGNALRSVIAGIKQVDYAYVSERVTQVTLSSSLSYSYAYDSEGRLDNVSDAAGNDLVSVNYDDYNRTSNTTTGTSDAQESFSLSARKTESSNEQGVLTTSFYDDQFRLLTVYDNLNRQLDYEYRGQFGPTRQMDSRGASTSYGYDNLGNVNTTTTHYGDKWRSYYNTSSLLSYIQNPTGQGQHFTYDAQGRAEYIYNYAQLEVDTNGDETGQILYNSANKTQYEYNSIGAVAAVTDPLGNRQTFTYNNDGLPVTVTSPSGRNSYREYDSLARVVRVYDDFGDLSSYGYDENDQVVSLTTPRAQVSFSYDNNGNLASTTDGRGSLTSYFYNDDSQLVRVLDAMGGNTYYDYNASGYLTTTTLPSGETQQIQYDQLNRAVFESAGI